MAQYRIRPGIGGQLIVTGTRMRGKSLDRRVSVAINSRDDLAEALRGLVKELYPERALQEAVAATPSEERVQ